jgi:hypothetical protein
LRLLLAGSCLLAHAIASAQGANDWVTINKDYSSQRYVDLDQINAGNVGALKGVCEAQLNEPSWFSVGSSWSDARCTSQHCVPHTPCYGRV